MKLHEMTLKRPFSFNINSLAPLMLLVWMLSCVYLHPSAAIVCYCLLYISPNFWSLASSLRFSSLTTSLDMKLTKFLKLSRKRTVHYFKSTRATEKSLCSSLILSTCHCTLLSYPGVATQAHVISKVH